MGMVTVNEVIDIRGVATEKAVSAITSLLSGDQLPGKLLYVSGVSITYTKLVDGRAAPDTGSEYETVMATKLIQMNATGDILFDISCAMAFLRTKGKEPLVILCNSAKDLADAYSDMFSVEDGTGVRVVQEYRVSPNSIIVVGAPAGEPIPYIDTGILITV